MKVDVVFLWERHLEPQLVKMDDFLHVKVSPNGYYVSVSSAHVYLLLDLQSMLSFAEINER
jgi:hypothetical protein